MPSGRAVVYLVDGVTMVGYLSVDPEHTRFGARRPGVLLAHEGGGQDDNVRARADRLAASGYVAFALDYFGGARQPAFAEAQARLGELLDDVDACRRLARAGLDVLVEHPSTDAGRLAAIGFCFGGFLALELARDGAPLRAVVAFHPGLYSPRPEDSARITASVLVCCGTDDPVVPVESRQRFEAELQAAGVADWRIELYGGVGHSFTNPQIDARELEGFAYDELADHRAWASMMALFAEVLDE
jgi:dienelactone hydrolase